MKTIPDLFSTHSIAALGWMLVHALWQSTLLVMLAAVTLYLLRKRSAQLRYLSAVAFLSLQVLASIATFTYYLGQLRPSPITGYRTLQNNLISQAVEIRPVAYSISFEVKIQIWLASHMQELVVCWLIGAAILLIRFAGGWLITERLRWQSSVVMDREWRARFGVMLAKMNIARSIEFRQSARIVTPMVVGALRPVVLIPAGLLTGFSTSQIEAILAHELAHIRRNDYLLNLFQSLVEVVFFFCPAIWWLSNRIRVERENCCDDIALGICGDKMSLAHALVKVAEWQSTPHLAMAFASRKPMLLMRVQRVLGLSPKPRRTIGNLPLLLVCFTLITGLSFYAMAQERDKPLKEKKSTQQEGRKHKTSARIRSAEVHINEPVIAEMELVEDIEPPVIEVEPIEPPEIDISFEDSLSKKLHALQSQMSPLESRLEDIQLEIEKHHFATERLHREMEKISWKKEQAMEQRSELMDKRSEVFDSSPKSGQQSADIDKQLGDFEEKIKGQEESIAALNAQLATTRKEMTTAEAPIHKLEAEMSELTEKMEELERLSGLHSLSHARVVRAPREPRIARPRQPGRLQYAPVPPPPTAARPPKPAPQPAKVPKPPKAPAAQSIK
jgi:bla regulator protein blaR1